MRIILLLEAIPSRHSGLLMVLKWNITHRGLQSISHYGPSHFYVICDHLLLFIFLNVRMLWSLTFWRTYFTLILTLSSWFASLKVA